MIDIHSHLIDEVDDGLRSLKESIDILSMMRDAGFKKLIITPHYIVDSKFTSSKKNNEEKLEIIKGELDKKDIDLDLYLGNEIYIDEKINDLLNKDVIASLNNSKYLLIELPLSGNFKGYQDIIYSLLHKGYIVILAHPERYIAFQKDFNKVLELKELGILFQSNYGFLLGDYGSGAKKLVKKLMKEDLITFFSSDIHRIRHSDFVERAKKKMRKYYTLEKIEKLTNTNAYALLEY